MQHNLDLSGQNLSETELSKKLEAYDVNELTTLDISSNSLTTLEPIKRFTQLTKLSACDVPIQDISAIRNFKQLKKLYLSGTLVNTIEPLAELKNLRELHLNDMPITDIKPLDKLNKLEELGLSGTKLGEDLSPLTHLTHLKRLYLYETGIDAQSLLILEKLSHLEKLGVDDELELTRDEVLRVIRRKRLQTMRPETSAPTEIPSQSTKPKNVDRFPIMKLLMLPEHALKTSVIQSQLITANNALTKEDIIERANNHFQQGEREKAFSMLAQVIKDKKASYDDRFMAHYNYGLYLRFSGKPQLALDHCNQAIGLLSKVTFGSEEIKKQHLSHIPSLINLSSACIMMQKYIEGLNYLEAVTQNKEKLLPEQKAHIFNQMASIMAILEDYKSAEEAYKTAIKYATNLPLKFNSLLCLGNVYFDSRKYQAAITCYQEAKNLIDDKQHANFIESLIKEAESLQGYLQQNFYKHAMPNKKTLVNELATAIIEEAEVKDSEPNALYQQLTAVYLSPKLLANSKKQDISAYHIIKSNQGFWHIQGGPKQLVTTSGVHNFIVYQENNNYKVIAGPISHYHLASGKTAIYAGGIVLKDGYILSWNNCAYDFKQIVNQEEIAGILGLPLEKFQPWYPIRNQLERICGSLENKNAVLVPMTPALIV